ncbi:MAG: hypothetical protein J7L39_00485 [Candidatus Aenigmarchaeota archaeon]|nr:hypothetical protein [Candidatus Aenigmarchaeota archaeon]
MKIKQIKQLDEGISNLTCKGKITYVGEAKNVKGEKDGRRYNFWTQFLVVEDDTDSIPVNARISEKDKLSVEDKGKEVEVIKATLQSYEKDGKKQLSLQGHIRPRKSEVEVEKEKNISPQVWEEKDLRMARMNALSHATELCVNKFISYDEIYKVADEMVNFIYSGMKKESVQTEIEKKEFKKEIPPDPLTDSQFEALQNIYEKMSKNDFKELLEKFGVEGATSLTDQEANSLINYFSQEEAGRFIIEAQKRMGTLRKGV